MENIFVDTSALFSLANTSEATHDVAWETMQIFAERNYQLITNNYVVVETFALIQSRLGIDITPLSANRRQLSLVDCSSFETMRHLGIEQVFTFDEHFRAQGFTPVP